MPKPPRAWVLPGGCPSVVLGRSQHALRVRAALPVRRRASGGGAVLAGPWLLRAAVRLPRGHPLLRSGPASLARWLGEVHLQWLHAAGVAGARMHAGPGREHWACFGGCNVGEVVVDGRKLTGIAQAWRRSGVLVAAGTLVHPPHWLVLCEAMERPAAEAAELAAATTTLQECLRLRPDVAAWADGLRAALRDALCRAELAADQAASPASA